MSDSEEVQPCQVADLLVAHFAVTGSAEQPMVKTASGEMIPFPGVLPIHPIPAPEAVTQAKSLRVMGNGNSHHHVATTLWGQVRLKFTWDQPMVEKQVTYQDKFEPGPPLWRGRMPAMSASVAVLGTIEPSFGRCVVYTISILELRSRKPVHYDDTVRRRRYNTLSGSSSAEAARQLALNPSPEASIPLSSPFRLNVVGDGPSLPSTRLDFESSPRIHSSPLTPPPPSPDFTLAPAAVIIPVKKAPVSSSIPIPTPRPRTPPVITMSVPDWHGSSKDLIDGDDFLRLLRLHYRTTRTPDAEIMADVADRFKSGSPAAKWFKALDPTTEKADWAMFQATFRARFPAPVSVETPRLQLLADVAGMRISLDEVAKGTVNVRGVEVPVLADFATRVNNMVTDAGLFTFHNALPAQIRTAVGAVPANWGAMVTALRSIPKHVVDAVISEHRRDDFLRKKVEMLEREFAAAKIAQRGTQNQQGAGQKGGGGAAGGGAGRGAGPAGGGAVGGGGAAGGGAGRGGGAAGGGAGGGGRRPPPTDAEKAALRRVCDEVVARRTPDTPEGRTLYETHKAQWRTRNGHIHPDNLAIERTGFPLTPGTAAPASGECWTCGVVTPTPHARGNCPRPALPDLESRFRAVCGLWLGGTVARVPQRGAQVGQRVTPDLGLIGGRGSASCTLSNEIEIVDLYTVDPREQCVSAPFKHWIVLHGPQGEKVRIFALFDTGAMVCVMDSTRFESVRGRLGKTSPPTKQLRLANGTIMRSLAHWEGEVEVEGVKAFGSFEVFDSGGSWDFLFSKPMQAALGVVHDVVTLDAGGQQAKIVNQNGGMGRAKTHAVESAARPEASTGEKSRAIPPARRVPKFFNSETTHPHGAEVDAEREWPTRKDGKNHKRGKGKHRVKTQGTSTGAKSAETTPARRVHDVATVENVDAAFTAGAAIIELDEEASALDGETLPGVEHGEGETGGGMATERVGDEDGGEESETVGVEEGVSTGKVMTRETATGARSRAIPPARRVSIVNRAERPISDRDYDEMMAEACDDDEVEVEWWDEGEEEEEEIDTTGRAPTCEASTGVKSCATPPARRVLFEILLPWMSADHAEQVAHVHDPDGVYTRSTDPFKPERVAEILKKVQIGPDLTDREREIVLEFLREFADIFALSVGEVNVVPGAVYAPKIPADAHFNMGVVHQRPWTLPQGIDANTQVDVLEKAGILRRIDPRNVKCVSPISLAEKEHGHGMTLNELVYELERQCLAAGLPPRSDLPPRDAPRPLMLGKLRKSSHDLKSQLRGVLGSTRLDLMGSGRLQVDSS
ncbi:hypothetical protein C8F04DRAFT_1236964 [Mycena alexandri]|uniref:Uncharacterized protein n=1 Tax=Mycena alexandri TaxID=1745969 RepID=A0AAD6SM69_9AGAR|nr:hypothetical protein C8F04DRAFT_1236964 [Mycena alexandri]